MRIECPDCDAVYNIRPRGTSRQAKCKQCGGLILVPAEEVGEERPKRRSTGRGEATRRDRRDEDEEEKPRVPISAKIAGGISILFGLVFTPLSILLGKGAATAATAGSVSTEAAGIAGAMIIVFGTFAVGFGGGGFGLLLRKGWAWWTLAFLHGFFVLLNAKLCTPLFHINWHHHRAWDTALPYLLIHAVPVMISLLVLVLLMLPSVRLLCGVKQEARPRRRRSAGRLQTGD